MNQAIATSSFGPTFKPAFVKPEAEQKMHLRIGRSLKMHRKAATAVFLLVAFALLALALLQKPQYLAQSLVYIQPSTPKPLTDLTPGLYDSSRYDSYIEQQLQTITREDILADALKKVPAGTWQLPNESPESAIGRLKTQLKVERVLNSYEVSIGLKGQDAAAVTRIVNGVTTAFLNKGRGDELAQSDQQLQSLSVERERLLGTLAKDREEQARLSTSLGVADTSSEKTGNPYDVQLEDLRAQVAVARQAHDVAIAQLAASGKGSQSSELLNAVSDEAAASDPALASLKISNTQRRSTLTTQMAGMTQTNPLYKQDQEELARLDESLTSLSSGLRSKASQQLVGKWKLEAARTGSVQTRLENQLAEQTAIATGATPKLQRASDLAAEIARLQARFAETDNAISSLEMQESSAGLAHLSLAAAQPQKPAASRRSALLALAFPFAFFWAVVTAVTLQKLDQRVYVAEDVDDAVRFQPMAVLPHPDDVNSSVKDEFLLRLVAGIDQAHRVGDAKTFVFTGASPGMQTSGLVDSLAQRMNEIGYKVMVSKASAALRSLKAEPEDHLHAGDRPLLDGKQNDSGPKDGERNEQLVRVKEQSLMIHSLKQVGRSADILFIDALPLLCSAETEFDTRLVDVTVVLAESGRTTRRDLTRSMALIQRLTTAGVATVLMDLRLRHADSDFLSSMRSPATAR